MIAVASDKFQVQMAQFTQERKAFIMFYSTGYSDCKKVTKIIPMENLF